MTTAFDLAAQSLMNDNNFAVDASYQALGDAAVTIRGAWREDLSRQQYGWDTPSYPANIVPGRRYFETLRSAIAAPRRGDTLTIGGVIYAVEGPDLARSDQYFWVLMLTAP